MQSRGGARSRRGIAKVRAIRDLSAQMGRSVSPRADPGHLLRRSLRLATEVYGSLVRVSRLAGPQAFVGRTTLCSLIGAHDRATKLCRDTYRHGNCRLV